MKRFTLNKTILNILSNFIPHEALTIDDKDPPWSTKKKKKIQLKNNVYKSYRNCKNNNNTRYLRRLKVQQEDLYNAIEVSKRNYYSRIAYKLTHIQRNTKVYWTLLKRFFNNKKIPLIPPLFHDNEISFDLFSVICNRFQEKSWNF